MPKRRKELFTLEKKKPNHRDEREFRERELRERELRERESADDDDL